MTTYDLAIIGSGPGGYVAALYASRHKLKTCVIEQDLLGGTCLNHGCIPTKSLINSASILSTIKNSGAHGIIVNGYNIDFDKMMARKDEVVSRLRTGIETLLRGNKIDLVKGRGVLGGPDTIDVEGSNTVRAGHIIIASGSKIAHLPNLPIDEKDILSSNGILNIKAIPRSIVVVGGGAVGCEFASLFRGLGCEVTIIELMDRLLPGQSREVSKKLETIFKKNGIIVITGAKVETVTKNGPLNVTLSTGASITAEKVLVSVGRVANIESLGLEKAGISVDHGKIPVDEYLRAAGTIYAIGDCVAGPQLAHKASYDGILACDNIRGSLRRADYSAIPNCIWTEPEVASVGLTEEDAKARHPDAKVAKFPYLASGKAYLEGKTEGFVKITGTQAGDILGVEIMGKDACNLIGEATAAKVAGMKIQEWGRVVHGHPTISEILQEAAGAFCGTPIHSI
jgi:dihydrolipoamide dehydrogenase